MAEVARAGVMRQVYIAVALATLLACAQEDGSARESTVTDQKAKQSQRKSTTLTFAGEDKWLRGSIAIDGTTAQDLSRSVPITVSLDVVDAVAANERLGGRIFEDQCVRLQFLYKRGPAEPAQALQSLMPHTPPLWRPWPMLCVYAGLQTTWSLVLASDQEMPQNTRQSIILTSGARRTAEEEFAVVLVRPAKDGSGMEELARSNWVRTNK